MTERIFKETSMHIESNRVIHVPKALKDLLLKNGWRDGQVFMFYDDKKNMLSIVPLGVLEKKLKNAAGLD